MDFSQFYAPFKRWLQAAARPWLGQRKPDAPMPEPAEPSALGAGAQACVSVVIPALNEERRIADVVAYALADPVTAEVIVIDDSSIDRTAELARQAGAQVVTSSMLGKGASMRDGLELAQCPLVAYLDGDLAGLRPHILSDLCAPLREGRADFVKARFGRGGGRVTELTAKPMLKIFFPELADFAQPLGGIVAATKQLLSTLPFEDGYGVDVGLLLDAHLAGARLAEVDIGGLEHESQPLHDLALMASEIGRVIFDRAKAVGRLHVEQVGAMFESQRQAAAGIDYVLTLRKQRQRLLLLDMDGTVTESRFAMELARATGQEAGILQVLEGESDLVMRSERLAQLFHYIHISKFEQVARSMALRPGVIAFVNQMRRQGFMVGVVSDSYFIAAEIVRRRIFADFAMAHTIVFDHDVCSGQIKVNPAFLAPGAPDSSDVSKAHVLRRFLDDPQPPKIDLTWVVGDDLNDLELMRLADRAFSLSPGPALLAQEPGITVIDSFEQLLGLLPQTAEPPAPDRPGPIIAP